MAGVEVVLERENKLGMERRKREGEKKKSRGYDRCDDH